MAAEPLLRNLMPFCTSSSDCSLTGACVNNNNTRCECDAGWRGRRCEALDLGSSSEAIRPASGGGPWTWGGSPAFDAKTSRWHLFYSFMVESCGLLHYQTNSIVRRAISTSGSQGPWVDAGVALAPRPKAWDSGNVHAPEIRYDATSRQWLLFYESTGWTRGPVDCRANRSAPSVYVSKTRRIGVAASASLDGPWRRLDAPILSPRPAPAWDSSDVSNAAPHVLPNGSVILAYRAGGDGVALGGGIGVAVAPRWDGPYERKGPTVDRMLFAAEDGSIFANRRGLHMLVHRFAPIPPNGSKVAAGVGGHAYSLDGLTWTYNASAVAYENVVRWRSNGSSTRLYRRERPQPMLDSASGDLIGLFNGAWPCHSGPEGDDSDDAALGCASFTMWTEVRSTTT